MSSKQNNVPNQSAYNPSKFDEKQKHIMKKKIEFLETQLIESSKREATLKSSNQSLRKALSELTSDKGNVLGLIASSNSIGYPSSKSQEAKLFEQNKLIDNLNATISELKGKLQEATYMNNQYKEQLRRIEAQSEQQLKQLTDKYCKDREYADKRLCQYQKTIDKYQQLYQESLASTVDREELNSLRRQNAVLKQKLTETNSMANLNHNANNNIPSANSSIHLQSFSTIIPDAGLNYSSLDFNNSILGGNNNNLPNYNSINNNNNNSVRNSLNPVNNNYNPHQRSNAHLLQYNSNQQRADSSLMLSDFESNNRRPTLTQQQNPMLSSKANRMTESVNSRQSISRSKSNMLLCEYPGPKPKAIATALYCESCTKSYPPNEFYRHLKACQDRKDREQQEQFRPTTSRDDFTRLLREKKEIEKQLALMNECGSSKREELESELRELVVILKNKEQGPMTSRPR